jgi:hypothetical protein
MIRLSSPAAAPPLRRCPAAYRQGTSQPRQGLGCPAGTQARCPEVPPSKTPIVPPPAVPPPWQPAAGMRLPPQGRTFILTPPAFAVCQGAETTGAIAMCPTNRDERMLLARVGQLLAVVLQDCDVPKKPRRANAPRAMPPQCALRGAAASKPRLQRPDPAARAVFQSARNLGRAMPR